MLFNSFNFILIFLPLMLLGWYGLLRLKLSKLARLLLIAGSCVFYSFFDVKFTAILLGQCLVNWGISLVMKKGEGARCATPADTGSPDAGAAPRSCKILQALGVLFNLGVLFVFKYYDFFMGDVLGLSQYDAIRFLLPVGISFYTFSQIAYLIDRGRGDAEHESLLDYAAFVTYFPKLIEGPICYHHEIIPQLKAAEDKPFDREKFTNGVVLFILGMGKKVLLADTLSFAVNYGFEQTYYLDTISVIFVMLAYAFQLYFDFSGYCDMATGISAMFGIDLPLNFNSPYKAASSKELWQRWHMTLTRFFIRYVYIPLGGSRRGHYRTLINVLIVFLLSGLWHGAGWTYLVWGAMQGLFVIWDDVRPAALDKWLTGTERGKKAKAAGAVESRQSANTGSAPAPRFARLRGQICTFLGFVLSLVFFRSEDLPHAFGMLRRFVFPTWPGWLYRTAAKLDISELYVLKTAIKLKFPTLVDPMFAVFFALLLVICWLVLRGPNAYEIAMKQAPSRKRSVLFLTIVFVWAFLSMSQVTTFIYFQY